MKVDFYEEFPSKENLKKLRWINFSSRLFIATKSLEEFKYFKKIVKGTNKKIKCIYWPIIKNSYWVSPFSNTSDLKDLFSELNQEKNKKMGILIDLEFPIKKSIIFKNSFGFKKNKKLITSFLEQNKKRIVTAQHPYSLLKLGELIGLNYKVGTEKSLMWYSSMNSEETNLKIKKILRDINYKKNFSISFGVIAKGILGNEPILVPKKFKKDLEFIKNAGFNKVIIFQLEGLDKEYIKIINKFI